MKEKIKRWMKVAKCPNCDGSGAIPHTFFDGDVEWEQCQWCAEKEEFLGELDKLIPLSSIGDVIKQVESIHPYKESGNMDSYSPYNEGWSDACDIMGNRILEMITEMKIIPLPSEEEIEEWLHQFPCANISQEIPDIEGNGTATITISELIHEYILNQSK